MKRSTKLEVRKAERFVAATYRKMRELLEKGKSVHCIWDFDNTLASGRSDDIFALVERSLAAYFAHEERLVLQSPEPGPWLAQAVCPSGFAAQFPGRFTQDIVTARSSTLAIRVYVFCVERRLPVRWTLFLGHQPKKESYRIILRSLSSDCHVFCIDDDARHIKAFLEASAEEGMSERSHGVVSPIVRTYDREELAHYHERIMAATAATPIRVRDPANELNGFIVLPRGSAQFAEKLSVLVGQIRGQGHSAELRDAFVRLYGEVGPGRFQTEEELDVAMKDFIMGIHCP